MIDEGDPAPDFELTNQEGDTVSLSEFEGKHVVLYFYPRADTRGCTIEAKGFRDNYQSFVDADAVVLGVSNDPVEDLEEFKQRYDLPFDLLSDPDGEVASAYDSYGTVELEGEEHEIAFRNTYVIGPDGTVEAAYERVEPSGHAEAILEDLAPA